MKLLHLLSFLAFARIGPALATPVFPADATPTGRPNLDLECGHAFTDVEASISKAIRSFTQTRQNGLKIKNLLETLERTGPNPEIETELRSALREMVTYLTELQTTHPEASDRLRDVSLALREVDEKCKNLVNIFPAGSHDPQPCSRAILDMRAVMQEVDNRYPNSAISMLLLDAKWVLNKLDLANHSRALGKQMSEQDRKSFEQILSKSVIDLVYRLQYAHDIALANKLDLEKGNVERVCGLTSPRVV